MRVLWLEIPTGTLLTLPQIRDIFGFANVHIIFADKAYTEYINDMTNILNARKIASFDFRVLNSSYGYDDGIQIIFVHANQVFHTVGFSLIDGIITVKDNLMELPESFALVFDTAFTLQFASEEDRVIFELSRV